MSNSPLTNAIIVTLLLFCATITVGWVGTMQNPAIGENLMKLFEKEVAGQIMGKDSTDIFVKLFFNNIEACILLFLGGASFGILTIFIMSLNGILIGAIMEIVHKEHSLAFVAAAILPHREHIGTAFGEMFPGGSHPFSRVGHVVPQSDCSLVQDLRGVSFRAPDLVHTPLECALHGCRIDNILNLR